MSDPTRPDQDWTDAWPAAWSRPPAHLTEPPPPPPPDGPDHPASPGPEEPPAPEPWRPTRRRVLLAGTGLGLAGAAGLAAYGLRPGSRLVGVSAPAAERSAPAPTSVPVAGSGPTPSLAGDGIVVLVTLYGGNDGLNTVVPIDDPAYLRSRPTIGYKPDEVLSLADGYGLNPRLTNTQKLWQQKQLAVVRGVSYPNPNLSHFVSMAIWQTASPTEEMSTGWLGRWLDATGQDPMRAISMGAELPPLLRGASQTATAVPSLPLTLPGQTRIGPALSALAQPGPDRRGLCGSAGASLAQLLAAQKDLNALGGVASPGPDGAQVPTKTGAAAPGGELTSQLNDVATLIAAGSPTRVYQASLSTFDTHAGERADQERMLAEFDAAIGSFFSKLSGTKAGDKVVLVAYSEFGRRVVENASGGTDHGTAGPVLVAGPAVKGGTWYGDQPSLSTLDANGNLVGTTDFRSVYATVMSQVLGVDPSSFLGGKFPSLEFV